MYIHVHACIHLGLAILMDCMSIRTCKLSFHLLSVDAVERLHFIVKSETAWKPAYSSVGGADDTRVPECTEGFMVLIKGIEGWCDRY